MTLATLEAQYDALPETLTATSGKGKHFYFVYPNDGNVIRNLAGQSVDGEVLERFLYEMSKDILVLQKSYKKQFMACKCSYNEFA